MSHRTKQKRLRAATLTTVACWTLGAAGPLQAREGDAVRRELPSSQEPASEPRSLGPDGPPVPARFAIVLGVNESVDRDAAPLHYADDDAAGFQELFRSLGAHTYLLSRFDDNTRRLHPQAVAEAHEPRQKALARVVADAASDVRQARERGVPTVLYVVYAGHGNVAGGRGYLALEDSRLFGAELERDVIDRVGAGETHVIVDACYSVFLAWSRGPGGTPEPLRGGFSALSGLGARRDVGLLLSTSSARESHEWAQFQAGVFSHEVRSGLLGAADADRDGHVSYREIAAFVERANAPVPNEKFRPDVYAKGPAGESPLLDLRPGLPHRLELGGELPGHYYLEDARGVRLADFHNAPGQPLHLVREPAAGRLFLRLEGADTEYAIESATEVARVSELRPRRAVVASRGAAHESFGLLFTLPFSQVNVDAYIDRAPATLVAAAPSPAPYVTPAWLAVTEPTASATANGVTADRLAGLRRPLGFGLVGLGVAAGGAGTWALLSALSLKHEPTSSQARSYELNQGIDRRNTAAMIFYGVGAAAAVSGAWLLFQASRDRAPAVSVSVAGGTNGDPNDAPASLVIAGAF